MRIRASHLYASAAISGVVGVILVLAVFRAWREYRSYTEEATGIVAQRTDSFISIRFVSDTPASHADTEHAYSVLSGGNADAPPEAAHLKLGDTVALVHPAGKPSAARLAEGFRPALPAWLGWIGAAMVVLAAVGMWLARRWQRRLRSLEPGRG